MKTVWKTALALYVVAQVLFLLNIQFPTKQNFDEFHYVPAAKTFYQFDKIPNREHPPLAKMIIGAGIAALGDNPPGWRVMSTVFGALTLVGMYFWGLALFRDEKVALWVALITLFNQLLYVQSRIAMLDTFMFAFLVWGFAAFTDAWRTDLEEHQVRRRLLAAGVLFGLATACKWFGLMGWLACAAMVGIVYIFKNWGVAFEAKSSAFRMKSDDFYSPELWSGLTFQDWIMYLGFIPAFVYFITFLPYLFFKNGELTLLKIIPFQMDMYGDQLRVVGSHPYMSQWKDWPLMTRPIWYAFDSDGPGLNRCVLLLGNPLVMWGGLLALLVCLWGFIRDRSREGFLIVSFYIGMFGSWVLIPRKVAFYYYYYPAGMVLSLALAYVFFFVGRDSSKGANKNKDQTMAWVRWGFLFVAFGLFVYFFPILAALQIPADNFRRYMWFQSWI
jgi:dolichyl-phosphate-mannose-protein mannosyltransferase